MIAVASGTFREGRFGAVVGVVIKGGLVFFSFWVLLGSSGVPSGVLLAFFWCSITQKNTRRTQKNPEEPDGRVA